MNNGLLGFVIGTIGTAYFTNKDFKKFADDITKKLTEQAKKFDSKTKEGEKDD